VSPNFARVQRVFREVLEDDQLQLTPGHTQQNLEAWDSFAHVKLIIGLEEEFGIKFLIDEVALTKSVSDLLKLVDSKVAALA
jgi:acyl carrier protein